MPPASLSLLKGSELLARGRRPQALAEIRAALAASTGRPALDPIAEYLPSMPRGRRELLLSALAAEGAGGGGASDAALGAARAALERGDRAAARAAARALESRPLPVALAKELSDVLLELGDRERALSVLLASARRDSGDARPWLRAAELAAELGRRAEAREALASAARAARGEDERMQLAFALGRAGDPAAALDLLDSLSRRPPPQLLVERAAFEAEAGRAEAALRTLASAGRVEDGPHARRAGFLYARLGRFDEAAAVLDAAGEASADRAALGNLLLAQAEKAAREGRPAEARRLLASKAAARGLDARRAEVLLAGLDAPPPAPVPAAVPPRPPPRDEDAETRRESARLAREGRVEPAAAALEALLRRSPADAAARVELAELRRRQGRAADALAVLEAAAKPRPAPVLAARASALQALGRRAEAAAALAEAERAAGEDRESLFSVAHGWQSLAEYGRADAVLTRLAALAPGSAAPLSDRGLVRHLAGREAEAAADLERAIALEPDFLPPYLTLGALRSAQGRAADAARLYDAALARPSAAREPALKALLEGARRAAR
ncbi:MAG: hypothetical protein M0D55_08885 [Elusimicrobiota bacterium]|nr:MAG: hypothetical protein M0D55_08885 [Elusimicrobiota bacterium]